MTTDSTTPADETTLFLGRPGPPDRGRHPGSDPGLHRRADRGGAGRRLGTRTLPTPASARRWRSRLVRRSAGRRDGRCLAELWSPARSSPATALRLVRTVETAVPRARVGTAGGGTAGVEEQGAAALRPDDQAGRGADRRHLSRRHQHPPGAPGAGGYSKGAIGKDAVSRIWRKVKTDWEAWSKRSLADEDVVRLILDGTVVRVRVDRKATSISLLVVPASAATGRRCCWRSGTWAARARPPGGCCSTISSSTGCRRREFLIVDGAAGLEKALAALWPEVPTQRCTVQ